MLVMLSATEWMGITAMRLGRSGYLIREGFRSIGTHGFMSFATVAIIMACLIIMGSVSLLSVNIDALIKDLEDQNEIVTFVDDTLSEKEARAIESELEAVENVSSVEFVSREEAMTNFMGKYDSSLMEGVDSTVFRHRYVIHLVDISLMAETSTKLYAIDGIADVKAHLDYASTFVRLRNVVTIVSLALVVLLVFVSIFIMTNTIKLATFSRREEIAIMKMVGATNSFIRLPFEIEGLTLGIMGSLLAFFAEWGLYQLISVNIVSAFSGDLFKLVPFMSVHVTVFVVYMAVGILVGFFGSINAIKNYLKV